VRVGIARVAEHGGTDLVRRATGVERSRALHDPPDALVSAVNLSTAKTWGETEDPPELDRSASHDDRNGVGISDRVLGATVRRGTMWSLAGYGGSQLLRFAGNLVLTRMLVPEAFGLMALLNALLQGLQLFSDIGIGPGIIQNRRGDEPAFLDTAWTVQVVRGFFLWMAACALALPFASFYGDPALSRLVPLVGLTALIAGFNSTRIFCLYRRVDLARISMLELGSQAAGIAGMIAFAALIERSIWALVAGSVAGTLAKMILSHTMLPGHANRFRWDASALGPMLRFGRWIFCSTILTFLVGQSDRLIFGKMVPIAMLGVYSVASMIALVPAVALSRMASSVFFPVYSRVHNEGGDLSATFGRARYAALVLGGWMISGLIGGGAAAVRLLYDERYVEAGWIVQVLAAGSLFAILESTYGAVLLARGETRWVAAANAGKLVGMVVLLPIGYAFGGFAGAVVGLAASDIVKYAVSALAASRAGVRGWAQDLRLFLWVACAASLGWSSAEFFRGHGATRFTVAFAVFFFATAAWAPLAITHWHARRKLAHVAA
jgi:O-antigen/teichoic acid export membrane protein